MRLEVNVGNGVHVRVNEPGEDALAREIDLRDGALSLDLSAHAVFRSYSEDNFIIRLFNPTNKLMKGSLALYPGIKEAWLANLNEEKKGKISPQSDGSILIELGPKKISTINITPKCK